MWEAAQQADMDSDIKGIIWSAKSWEFWFSERAGV